MISSGVAIYTMTLFGGLQLCPFEVVIFQWHLPRNALHTWQSTITGLEQWTGLMDWNSGLDWWTGLVDSLKLSVDSLLGMNSTSLG